MSWSISGSSRAFIGHDLVTRETRRSYSIGIVRFAVTALFLNFTLIEGAAAAKPDSSPPPSAGSVLPPGGNTIAGPGGFNLPPDEGAVVYRSEASRFCVTLVVTSPDVTVRLNLEGLSTLFVTNSASRSACSTTSPFAQIICDVTSLTNCSGFWRVDNMP